MRPLFVLVTTVSYYLPSDLSGTPEEGSYTVYGNFSSQNFREWNYDDSTTAEVISNLGFGAEADADIGQYADFDWMRVGLRYDFNQRTLQRKNQYIKMALVGHGSPTLARFRRGGD